MLDTEFEILSNKLIAKNTWELVLRGDTRGIAPGQFVHLKLPGFYLRRPLSVCDFDAGTLTLIYKVVGHGTEALAAVHRGDGGLQPQGAKFLPVKDLAGAVEAQDHRGGLALPEQGLGQGVKGRDTGAAADEQGARAGRAGVRHA